MQKPHIQQLVTAKTISFYHCLLYHFSATFLLELGPCERYGGSRRTNPGGQDVLFLAARTTYTMAQRTLQIYKVAPITIRRNQCSKEIHVAVNNQEVVLRTEVFTFQVCFLLLVFLCYKYFYLAFKCQAFKRFLLINVEQFSDWHSPLCCPFKIPYRQAWVLFLLRSKADLVYDKEQHIKDFIYNHYHEVVGLFHRLSRRRQGISQAIQCIYIHYILTHYISITEGINCSDKINLQQGKVMDLCY